MPGFDKTGPMGLGSMTGGGRGLCNPASTGYEHLPVGVGSFGYRMAYGRGFRGGFGYGINRGFGKGFVWNTPQYLDTCAENPIKELDILKLQADSAKKFLDSMNRRITELEKISE